MVLPKRKPNRLKNYDYSQNGAYFITICTKGRQEILWGGTDSVGARIARPTMRFDTPPRTHPITPPSLSECGKIVDTGIRNIPLHYTSVSVDQYVIMPNHIHLILMLRYHGDGRAMRAPTVSSIINQLKGYTTKQAGFPLWQKSFHDHIIRNEREYQKIWEYIVTNPLNWENDCFYNNKSTEKR